MATHETSSTAPDIAAALRALPSVDALTQTLAAQLARRGRTLTSSSRLSHVARIVLDDARHGVLARRVVDTSLDALAAIAAGILQQQSLPAPRPLINATGVILNTNLGRAPLSDAARHAVNAVARGYSALEYDLEQGERGSRQAPVRALLRKLVGAEDALVVNNNAAAMLVILSALASGREVVISRGELVEIGGGFRIPDVLRQSGARLVEVGTTNRTRIGDFRAAIRAETALLLSVHPSNYRVVGFTAAPALAELAQLAHEHDLPLVHDLGSGALLRTERWGLAHEPMPQESLAAGADLVCFSGDKLLGGPQAGILAGKSALIAQIERHPLMRAVRIDKMTLAALVATLGAYRDETAETEIPVWRMIATPLADIEARAKRWAEALRSADIRASVQDGFSTIGGGSIPGGTLPTQRCAIEPATALASVHGKTGDAASALAASLRHGRTTVVARVLRDHVLLDPRTVLPEQDTLLLQAVVDAVERA